MDIETNQRVSRKRRHLPISMPSTITRSRNGQKHLPLLKMSYRNEEELPKRKRDQERLKRKARRLVTGDSRRKYLVWLISAAWILFMIYRIFNSIQKEDYANLSLVHFIALFI
ncbi:hypothetical protein EDC96DRAFT_545901 [Choanephora cucurbitarum]|nr:hypothetical protein EDC96DRAFT_545901 [Choanephora cucurbitarum]